MLDQLRTCTPGVWYSLDVLLYALWKQAPLDPYQKSPASGGSVLRTRWKKWRKAHEEQYVGMLTSTLSESGLLSLGYEHAPEETHGTCPTVFLATDLGAAALAGDTSGESHRENVDAPALIVQPSFEILVLHFKPTLLYQVMAFADIDCLEWVSRFHLRKTSVLNGLAAGLRIEDILDFLRQQSRVGLPQNVEYTLLDWSKTYLLASKVRQRYQKRSKSTWHQVFCCDAR